MKRRDFLKTAAIAGGAAGTGSMITSCKTDISPADVTYLEVIPAKQKLETLENEYIRATLFNDASAEIRDKKTGRTWKMSPVAIQDEGEIEQGHFWLRKERSMSEDYPGRFIGKKQGDAFRFTMIGRLNALKGEFSCRLKLEQQWLKFEISDIDAGLPSLVFPPPIYNDALVIPSGIGKLIRKKDTGIYSRFFYTFFTHLNMRWIGGLKDDAAWMGIFGDNFEDSGAHIVNGLTAPGWLKSLGKWRNKYSISYCFMKGGYVELAKAYRQWAKENGLFRTLEEKMREKPALKNYAGGRLLSFYEARPGVDPYQAKNYWFTPGEIEKRGTERIDVSFTHNDVTHFVDTARKEGFKRGPVIIRGWIKGGYDASHPDIWPPDPAMGDISELKTALNRGEGITGGLHDNYQDMYEDTESFPFGLNVQRNGEFMAGGYWAGGQAFILESKASLKYAKRNWEKIKTLDPAAMFIDTTTAAQLLQSYDEKSTQTRAQDHKFKFDLLKFYHDQGRLVGSEEGADFAVPVADWYENRHTRVPGESVPLWPLVFHDAVFGTRYHPKPAGDYPSWLEDMLWGYLLLFNVRPEWMAEGSNRFDKSLPAVHHFGSTFHVDAWHRQIGTVEMTGHRFLSEDFNVEMTTFANGKAIICNFGDAPYHYKNKTIKQAGYLVVT